MIEEWSMINRSTRSLAHVNPSWFPPHRSSTCIYPPIPAKVPENWNLFGVNNKPAEPCRLGDRHQDINYIVISIPRTSFWIRSTCRGSSCTLWIWSLWRSLFWSPGLFRSSFVWVHLCYKIWRKKVCGEVFSINKGFKIVMSFCLATETVERRLLF